MLTSKTKTIACALGAALVLLPLSASAKDGEAVVGPIDERAAPVVAPLDESSARAIEGPLGFDISANVAVVSEYRFRGVDLSGGDPAIQGGLDLAHSSGFYVGTWASSLDNDTVGYGDVELDVYGGYATDLAEGFTVDIGVIGYLYPDAGPGDFDYVELYGSFGFDLGPASAKVGAAYAPDQNSLGSRDNLYVYTDLSAGLPGTPVTLTGHLGYTDGALTFTNDSKAWDWSVGAEASLLGPLTLGVSYVGVEDDIPAPFYNFGDDAVVVSLSARF